jgi:hypothetical protein
MPQPVDQDGTVLFSAPDRPGTGLVPIPSAAAPRFYALPPDATSAATVPLYAADGGGFTLRPPDAGAKPVCRVWPSPARQAAVPPSPAPLPVWRE